MAFKSIADTEEEFDMTVGWGSAIHEFFLVKESEGYTAGTIKTYRSILQMYMEYCLDKGFNTPESVSKRDLRVYISVLSEKYAVSYVNNHISRIKGFYDFLCAEDYIDENSDPSKRVKMLPKSYKMLVVFNDTEVSDMIEAAGNQKNKFYAERDKLILMILADCGLRVNELVTLLDKNVTENSIFVHKAKKRKQRMLYVTPAVAKQLIRYRRVRKAYFKSKGVTIGDRLFVNFRGEHIENCGVEKMMKRLGQRIELRSTVRNSPHTLRHWFAQAQLSNGVSIFTLSRLLGHESISTTQTYLRGIADEKLINSAITTSPLLNMKK